MAGTPTHHPDGTPTRLGRYRLLRPISTGGMARVFEGVRESLAGVTPRVAIKVILPDYASHPGFRELFENEARIGSMLRHQNLVQIQDFDRDADTYYLVMEYVEGITLRQAIRRGRKAGVAAPLDVVVDIGRQVCDGLQHLHAMCTEDGRPLGLVHRDLKPSNLIINPQGVVKLLDFGVSRALSTNERKGSVRGTWGYMPPEQALGEMVSAPADLFGLAAVLYELVALQPLFPEKEPEEIKALMARDEGARRAYRLVGSCGPLAGVLVRALQRDPSARFASASAMGRALADLVSDPVLARDEVVRYQARMVQLAQSGAAPDMPAPVAPIADAERTTGLPIGVGNRRHPHRPTPVSASTVSKGAAPALPWVAVAGAGFVFLAVAIIAFTAWQVLARPGSTRPVEEVPEVVVGGDQAEGAEASSTTPEVVQPRIPGPEGTSVAAAQAVGTVAPEDATAAQASASGATSPSTTPPGARPSTSAGTASKSSTSAGSTRASTSAAAPSSAGQDAPGDPEAEVVVAAPDPEPKAATARSEPAALGVLTISSVPRSQVIMDGKFVRLSPLFRYKVPVGNHEITLISEDGRRVSFQVEVPAEGELRRVWSFDQGAWMTD